MAKLLAIFVLCLFGATTYAQHRRANVCTLFETFANFNVTKFTGRWYMAEAYSSIPNEVDNLCTYEEFILQNDGTYKIIRKSLFASDRSVKRTEFATSFPHPADEPARFTLTQHGRDYEIYDEWILDTDYESYAIAYMCAVSLVRTNGRMVVLMTRQQIPLQSTLTKINEFVRDNNLQRWTPIKFNQTNCDNII